MDVSKNEIEQRPDAPAEAAAKPERTPDKHEANPGPSRVRRFLARPGIRRVGRGVRKVVRGLTWIVVMTVMITIITAVWGINSTRVIGPVSGPVVRDFTHLYPVEVNRIIAPTTEAQIVQAVRETSGPISIGGGRFSMGGQTATEGALQIDMRRYNRILHLDTAAKTVTVQAGATWRQIQELIDRYGLSIKVMQSYGNFTVGGSLSVNVHGRYMGLGPIISTVRSFRIVLADGTARTASRTENPEIFYGAIGGYGGLGVITQATLDLADNVRVRRTRVTMPVSEYGAWFRRTIRERPGIIFHNADIYPNEYDRVSAVTFTQTADSVTIPDRLMPRKASYPASRWGQTVVTGWPGGKEIREHVLDPWLYRGNPVVWRNYEASYDVRELEPSSRRDRTYVLQEYFIPIDRFDAFVPRMREIFRRHDVNVVNVSIRHAMPDPGSLLAWAGEEKFAFVVWYKQRTDAEGRAKVAQWTREMADAALASGGSWYLPYQPHATPQQFARAYPRAPEFFALKRRLDPQNRFRNKLWDRYDPAGPARMELGAAERAAIDRVPNYARPESQSFLAHPEWYIVYSADEYAAWTRDRLPHGFPYARSIGQYWRNWGQVARASRRENPGNGEYSLMLGVIGVSYSVEYALKGAYENTIGRVTAWTAGGRATDEDRFAARVAADYGTFIHTIPWYQYPFGRELKALWTDVPLWGRAPVRKWERRLSLTVEYGIKAVYASMISGATGAAYAPEDLQIGAVVYGDTASLAPGDRRVVARRQIGPRHSLVTIQRYDAFWQVMRDAARRGEATPIVEIAGNDDIVVTGVAPANWRYVGPDAEFLYALPLPSDARRIRPVLKVRTRDLLPFLHRVQAEGRLTVDHVYDY
ncbi:MAG TPA: FAD-binding oxidoreductase [Longimicrobium sp.]|jgi:FAD/FMN-containing dehydrogenase|nr:FAD-binding oxidoreductase [Longimicrobium sp.]